MGETFLCMRKHCRWRSPASTAGAGRNSFLGNFKCIYGRVDFSDTRYVPKEYFDSLAEIRIPQCGDLLFTVTGSYGIVIPVQTERKFCFQRHIALIKFSCLSPDFMKLWLSSPLVYEQCRRAATGTAQKTVGLASLKGLLIPIPPLNEQKRIVQKLNTLLALATL